MRKVYNILIVVAVLCGFTVAQDWSMTITADDIGQVGSSDYIILGMCDTCSDSFQFGEDEFDLPPPPGYYSDISFFNFDWVGLEYGDSSNPNFVDSPEFYIDKRSFHDPIDLLIWEINGFANLDSETNNIQLSWVMDDLPEEYEIFLYIGDSSFDMRNTPNVVISQEQLAVDYDPVSGDFTPNIRVVLGGCAQSGDITEYFYDNDGDGLGSQYGEPVEYCTGKEPSGWVENNNDLNDEIYCESNTIDQCDDCDGQNICVGCSDPNACNYSDLITIDDGSCYYIEEYYDCDGSCLLDSDFDGVCDELENPGCTNFEACNYDPEATEEDGSCEYPNQYYDCDGSCLLDSDFDGVCDELEILGCTNSESCLFNPDATEHDGSCCEEGDSSCIESPGEINNLNVSVELNSVVVDWEQPCGISTIWIYRLLENEDDVGVVVPSPFTIEDLEWGTEYTYYIKTINTAGSSITEFTFTTQDEPLPDMISISSYDSGEAQILLNWSPSNNIESYNVIRDGEVVANISSDFTQYIDDNISFYPDIYYEYQIQGVNSQGNVGPLDSPVSIQPAPIPLIDNLISLSNPGSITFSWSNPEPYASVADYLFQLSSDSFDLIEIDQLTYTVSDLSFGDEVCVDIKAIHQFGESSIESICDYPEMPYPPLISNFNAIGGEGHVNITWTMLDEPNHFINIYRDQELIISNLNSIENPPPYINDIYDGYGMLADQEYSYAISASNAEFIEGDVSESITVATLPLPIVSDLSAEPGDGRIILNWSDLDEYAGFNYIYQIVDNDDNIIVETDQVYATISGLVPGQEHCFKIKASSLGGYGVSDASQSACAIPQDVFDGTEGDNDIDWGIQLSVDLLLPGGDILRDTQNMLGVAGDATDECDPIYDVAELTDTPNYWAKLHFPHQDWDCALVSGSKYNNDIRSPYEDSNEVKEWDVHLETNSWEGGIATISFYFYENAGHKTAYYTVDSVNYTKINDGDQIEYGLINPAQSGSFKVIVGNIVPEAPLGLESNSGYRELELSWDDGYIPGELQYESSSYNIYRNNQLIANTLTTSYIDRGLDFSTEYEYQVSGVNIAGEGQKSDIINAVTLNNRAPIANAGIDLLIYDFSNDNIDQAAFSLPMNVSGLNNPILSLSNESYDLDNMYFENGQWLSYEPTLDQLSFIWESSSGQSQTGELYSVYSEGYGLKLFTLEVDDGNLSSAVKDSIYIDIKPLPVPAKVNVDTLYTGLYSIDIFWEESNYTGEPYIKSNINSDIQSFEAGDYFEDINNNGVYDPGLNPMPPFYGLSNLNNSEGYKSIADFYQVYVDGVLVESVVEPCDSNPDNIYLNQYCYSIEGLDPSTVYSINVSSCNFNSECNDSENIYIATGDMPYANVVSPNGAEIVGMDNLLNIQLDFGLGQRYIDSLYLSLLTDNSSIWDTTIFVSASQNIIDNQYAIAINDLSYSSGLNPDSEISIAIVDEGGMNSSNNNNYYDESDYPFIITSNQIEKDFSNGWYIIGTPVVLDSNLTLQSHINSGVDMDDGINFWQIVDEQENIVDPISPSEIIFNSGKGYYFNLYSTINQDFSETLILSGDVKSEYLLTDLNEGWNLISNPLVMSMNINNVDIIDIDGNHMSWASAIESGIIAPYLLDFNHIDNTLYPSYSLDPYKGYWVYLYEDISMYFENKVNPAEDINGDLSDTDFILNLKSRAFGATSSSFGDLVQLGYGIGASNNYVEGVDIPDLGYQYFNEYTSMYILHDEAGWNSEYNQLSRDVREHYQPVYHWDIKGDPQAIYDPVNNPDAEIELFWDMSEIDSNYTVVLKYGLNFSNQIDMKENSYVKLNEDQFLNMRVSVELQDYLSGCSNQNACNYFCIESPWECPGGILPANFVDDDSCDLLSCLGCMDSSASNYNPNATIDSICEGGYNDGINCMYDESICGELGDCIEQICEYNESYQFPLSDQDIYVESSLINEVPISLNNYNSVPVYGVEIELVFDSEMVQIPSLDFSGSIISDYSKLYYIDNDTLRFVAYSGTPTLSSGLLFDMQIEAVGSVGSSTSISFSKSVLNDYSIGNNTLGLNLSQGLFEVSGYAGYYSNDNYPVDLKLDLIGYSEYNNPYSPTVVDTLLSIFNEPGDYGFNLGLRGSYIAQASRFELPGSDTGLSAVDASRIARYLIDLIDFNEYQLLAADVDMNGQISAVDAALVARYLIGLIDEFNDAGQHWRFSSSDGFYFNLTDNLDYEIDIYDLRPLSQDFYNQNIRGIRIGDVDGSWISDTQIARKSNGGQVADITVNSDGLLSVPIAIQNSDLIEGIDLRIVYDSESLIFDNLELSNDLFDYSILINDSADGELSLIIYANSNIENINDVFGQITFTSSGDKLSDAVVEIERILINGQDVQSGFLLNSGGEEIYSRLLSVSSYRHPNEFSLGHAYPNPFNPSTQIPFALPFDSNVHISVYDINGRFVRSLVASNLNEGNHFVEFDGSHLSTGIYIIRMSANSLSSDQSFSGSNKILLLK